MLGLTTRRVDSDRGSEAGVTHAPPQAAAGGGSETVGVGGGGAGSASGWLEAERRLPPLLKYLPHQFVAQDAAAGVAWAGSLPDRLRDEIFSSLLSAAWSTDKLPSLLTAMESLPAVQQQAAVEKFVARVLGGGAQDSDARLVQRFKAIPPAMQAAARQAVEAAPDVAPARRAAALNALR
jgi:hypothetical protein